MGTLVIAADDIGVPPPSVGLADMGVCCRTIGDMLLACAACCIACCGALVGICWLLFAFAC